MRIAYGHETAEEKSEQEHQMVVPGDAHGATEGHNPDQWDEKCRSPPEGVRDLPGDVRTHEYAEGDAGL